MIKLVVFDWNGVLIADRTGVIDADNEVIKAFGGEPVDAKVHSETIIIPSINFYAQHGIDRKKLERESDKAVKVFHETYEPRVSKVRTRRNARKLLEWLRENNVNSIILSNHTVAGISAQLQRLKIENLFVKLIANEVQEAALKKRGKGEKLEAYLQDRQYKSNEVLIIGDSPEEIEIGKRLGLVTVGITGGYYSTRRLKKISPDYLISDLGQLIGIIKKL